MTTGGSSIYWDDGTCRQRIINTDDSTANTAVFNFQQSENTGSSWKNLLEIRDNGLLILTQNSGGIYKQFSTANQQPMIYMRAGDIDNYLFEISDNITTTTHGHTYGFGLKYIGSGYGENNALDLIADNMGGTDITAISVSNNGKIGIGDKFNTNYRLYVNGNSYLKGNNFLYGDLSAFYDGVDQYLQYTAEGTVANHAAKISLYRIIASGKAGTAGTKVPGVQLDAATGMLHLQAAASDPSASAGARIKFTYWNAADSNGQPVYISHSINDTYRGPYGLKIWGSDEISPGAWLEIEGNLYIGSASNSNSNDNAALYIRGMSAIEGYDTWLRLNDNSSFTSGTYSPKLIRSDEALQVGSGGVNFYANTARTYVQTHLAIAGSNDNYNFYVSGNSYLSNTLNFAENTTAINFRPGGGSYYTTISYQTTGNEALVFAAKNTVTSFMFVTGEDSVANHASNRWTVLSPTLQIKNKSVYVNSLIANGTNPSYNFYVNGTSYFNGATTINSTLTTNGLIYQTSNGNTLTLGAQNNAYCHITSSALNFYFNRTIEVDGNILPYTNNSFDLGSTGKYWRNIYGITFHGALDGNAATATKLAMARTITIGAASKTFDGTANISYTPYEMKLVRALYNTDSNLNAFANRGHALGMCNLVDNGSVDNPGGKTGWHHVINLTWIDAADNNGSTTNEYCTQIANACGSSDLYVRSRGGGSIANGTAWVAPWTKILTDANYGSIADNRYVKKSGDTMTGNLTAPNVSVNQYLKVNAWSGYGTGWGGFWYDGNNKKLFAYSNEGNDAVFQASKVYGAVWNDYAEYRSTSIVNPGQCVVETGLGDLIQSTKRLQPGANIVSDTYGFAIGETEQTKTPLAVSGRVLAYPYEDRYSYSAGDPVCSGPNGTISKMTREEVRKYPDRIVGTVSEIPEYETWGTGNVKVDGRIWIKVR